MSMSSDAANQWTRFYTEDGEMMYPAEAVIRIFKGKYPKLTMPRPKAGDSILDIGCGDGRHFPLFASFHMHMAGSEITGEIIKGLRARLAGLGLVADLRIGTCAHLPWFEYERFDYALAWNSCYYMNTGAKFEDHVAEMARVIKPGGWIVCSIPKKSCFIFRDCEPLADDRYVRILDEHFGLRNGEVMRRFYTDTRAELENEFNRHFTNFCHADIDIDMFGLDYNWHVFTAERRIP